MSKVKQFVSGMIKSIEQEQIMPATWKDRRVTVRLNAMQYGALLLVVRRISGSATGCAEALLVEALGDALEAIGYASFHDASKDIVEALEADSEHQDRRLVNQALLHENDLTPGPTSEFAISPGSEDDENSTKIRSTGGARKMTNMELYDLLGKIGKRVFVQHYADFGNPSISNQEIIARLPLEYTFKSRTSRTSKSRRIFREGLELQALSLIAASDGVEPETKTQARALLDQFRTGSSFLLTFK